MVHKSSLNSFLVAISGEHIGTLNLILRTRDLDCPFSRMSGTNDDGLGKDKFYVDIDQADICDGKKLAVYFHGGTLIGGECKKECSKGFRMS